MIVADFDNNFWTDRFPFAAALGAPATRTARRAAAESRWFTQCFEFSRERGSLAGFERGREPDVMKQTIVTVQTEEQGAENFFAARITKSTDHAIGAANLFDFHRRSALARGVGGVDLFSD